MRVPFWIFDQPSGVLGLGCPDRSREGSSTTHKGKGELRCIEIDCQLGDKLSSRLEHEVAMKLQIGLVLRSCADSHVFKNT